METRTKKAKSEIIWASVVEAEECRVAERVEGVGAEERLQFVATLFQNEAV